MPLTLLVAVATIAFKSGNIDENFYSSFILASLFEAIIGMVGVKILLSLGSKKAAQDVR